GGLTLQRLLVANPQRQLGDDCLGACLLRQERRLDARRQFDTPGPLLDVLGRWVEELAGGDRLAALVVLEQVFGLRRFWNARSRHLLDRDIHARGPVRGLQVARGDARHVRGLDLLDAVAVPEAQAPVALPDPLAQL